MIFSFPNRMVSDPAANRKPRDRDIFEGPNDMVNPNDSLLLQNLT